MKKVVRMLGFCALVALAFTSCKKNETKGTMTFKAAVPETTSDNRTHLNQNNWVVWDNGNEITVFNNDGSDYIEAVLKSGKDLTNATFEGDANFLANIGTADQYTAFYPVKTNDGTNITFEIPTQQSYVEDGFEDDLYPMFATNVNSALTNFQFRSQAALLTIPVKMGSESMQPYTIGRIVITALNTAEQLVGTMTYNYAAPYNATPVYGKSATSNQVELINCDTKPLTTDARYFNFVVFEGALMPQQIDNTPVPTFKIELFDENDIPIVVYDNQEEPQPVDPVQGWTPYGTVAQERTMMQTIVLKN